eukprot:3094757-Prymnesium_polylepis.1
MRSRSPFLPRHSAPCAAASSATGGIRRAADALAPSVPRRVARGDAASASAEAAAAAAAGRLMRGWSSGGRSPSAGSCVA